MNFDWSQYLVLATTLAQEAKSAASEEAWLRCAISRSYYSAFCEARNRLRDKEKVFIPLTNSHIFVSETFKQSPNLQRRQIGVLLERMKYNRRIADYENVFGQTMPPFTPAYVLDLAITANLKDAATVLSVLNTLP